jgi:hypothetical protein
MQEKFWINRRIVKANKGKTMESSETMNHQEAEKTSATERYLLRQMTDQERMAFEDHYLDCAQCLEAVTLGADFLDAGRELAEEGRFNQPTPVPAHQGWFGLWQSLRQPIPALAMAAAVCLAVLGVYQQTKISSQQNLIAELKAPRQEVRYVLKSEQRSGSGPGVLRVPRRSELVLEVEFTPKPIYKSYRVDVVSAANVIVYSFPFSSTAAGESVMVPVSAEILAPGRTTLLVKGVGQGGQETEAGNGVFDLQFTN